MFAVRSTGSPKWSYDIGPAEYNGGSAIASDGTRYMYATLLTCTNFCYGSNAYWYAINSNGNLNWRVLASPKATPIFCMTPGADGTIYLGHGEAVCAQAAKEASVSHMVNMSQIMR
jgi:outer membrane protein assembly factor BamB